MNCYIEETPIYYQEYGSGIPVLCLHGYSIDHQVMTGCLEPLFQTLDGYKRIYLDLPGMGKSPANENIKNADDMLEVIKKFIDKVIGKENFLLIGESYGCYLSLGLVLHLEQRIDGLFLICPVVVVDREKRILPRKELLECEDGFIKANEMDSNYTDFMACAVVATEETFARYKCEIPPAMALSDPSFVKRYQREGYGFSFDSKIEDIAFEKPTCVLLGRQDNVVGYMDALKLVNNFSRATFVIADGAGHSLQTERENLFEINLIDWLERI